MFTLKYIYPTGQEMISGPYAYVNAEWQDAAGNHIEDIDEWDRRNADPAGTTGGGPRYLVVHAINEAGNSMHIGPIIPGVTDVPTPRKNGFVFVMNESGATVAKYVL